MGANVFNVAFYLKSIKLLCGKLRICPLGQKELLVDDVLVNGGFADQDKGIGEAIIVVFDKGGLLSNLLDAKVFKDLVKIDVFILLNAGENGLLMLPML